MESKKIFISNRLPFNINPETNEVIRGSGGLVSALLGVSLNAPFYWMGFDTNEENAKKLEEQSYQVQQNLILKPVIIEKSLYDSYYDKFSNDVLWPLFHYESQHTLFQRTAWEAYIEANRVMAEAVLKIANDNDTIWIHDFHFFYLPKLLKEKKPNLKIGVFLHTPFPSSEIFRQLPVREEFLSSVIKCDLIGFHTHSYLRNFSDSLKAIMGINSSLFKATIGKHQLHLGVYPVSIDSEGLKKKALLDNVEKKTQELKETIKSPFLILGVDRLDYSKGLRLKMRGFSRFLKKYPELRGKVNLLQVAIPTRVTVPTYISLKNEIDKLVGEINGHYGEVDYVPVTYVYNSVDEEALLSLYKRADCALVTSKRDGMNLVAMEYAVCQSEEHPGVLILSEFTGAASLLGDALIINPWDEDSIADAIYKAYHMQLSEKLERCNGLQEILTKYSSSKWASTFLGDLEMTSNEEILPTIKIDPDYHQWPEEMKESLKTSKKIKLFLDYDGTLVGLKKKPDEAVIGSKMKELVADLNKKLEISVVSGRSPEFLDSQFADLNLEMAAEHGAYYKGNDHQWVSRVTTDIQSWFPEVIRVMESYAEKVPRSFVEIKNSSVVWHFRQSPEDFAMFQAKKLDEELQACLANQPVIVSIGSKIVEAKAIECNKGDYLRFKFDHMKGHADDSFIICLGDDKTDEDMFQMARDKGLTIKIGNEESAAQYSLERQSDVYHFLSGLKEYYESISQI